jgi:hypothetical protein
LEVEIVGHWERGETEGKTIGGETIGGGKSVIQILNDIFVDGFVGVHFILENLAELLFLFVNIQF